MPLNILLFLVCISVASAGLLPLTSPPSTPRQMKPRATMRMGRRSQAIAPQPKNIIKTKAQEVSEFLCPAPTIACPIQNDTGISLELDSLADWFNIGFECMDALRELGSCGGCATLGQGADCSNIPNVRLAACIEGRCVVSSCKLGYRLNPSTHICDINS